MDLILIRHGLPATITGGDGPADPPLNGLGRLQAERAAAWLATERIDALYSSPLARARQTAEPFARAFELDVAVHDGVAEYDRESAEYIPLEELRRSDYARWRQMMRDGLMVDQDPLVFRQVVADALEEIIAENRGGRVAVVCHGGVINAWTSYVLGMEKVLFFQPTYTSINRFAAAGSGERSVLSLNEAAHLRGLEAGATE